LTSWISPIKITAVRLLPKGSGRHDMGKNPVNAYFGRWHKRDSVAPEGSHKEDACMMKVERWSLGVAVIFSVLLFTSRLAAQAGPDKLSFPADLLVKRAQPAVYMLLTYGDIEIGYPREAGVKMDLLRREYDRAKQRGDIPAGRLASDFYWHRIAADGPQYLQPSSQREMWRGENVNYSSGTAFAVSREGILLTNAHNLADPHVEVMLRKDPSLLASLLNPALKRTWSELST
jgi:hypothetical protein